MATYMPTDYESIYNELLERYLGTEYYPISQSDWIYSYQSIFVSLEVEDSFQEDDVFNIYNGQKEVIKVQYASSLPNSFVNAALSAIKKAYSLSTLCP